MLITLTNFKKHKKLCENTWSCIKEAINSKHRKCENIDNINLISNNFAPTQ